MPRGLGKVGEFGHRGNSCCLVRFPEEEAPLQEEAGGREEAPRVVDLQQLVPLGGVYHIDALQLPPQVQDVGDWSMVEVRGERDQPCRPGPPWGAAPEGCRCCHRHWTRLLSSKLMRQGLQIISFSYVKGKSTVLPEITAGSAPGFSGWLRTVVTVFWFPLALTYPQIAR